MTGQLRDQKLGKLAYDAYCVQTGGVSLISGVSLPPWDGLQGRYQDAWISAARVVEANVLERIEVTTADD